MAKINPKFSARAQPPLHYDVIKQRVSLFPDSFDAEVKRNTQQKLIEAELIYRKRRSHLIAEMECLDKNFMGAPARLRKVSGARSLLALDETAIENLGFTPDELDLTLGDGQLTISQVTKLIPIFVSKSILLISAYLCYNT